MIRETELNQNRQNYYDLDKTHAGCGGKAFNLAYRSQNETFRDRLLSKAQDIRRRLGGSASLFEPFPYKPKGMHWATYWRLRAESERAEQISLMLMAPWFGMAV